MTVQAQKTPSQLQAEQDKAKAEQLQKFKELTTKRVNRLLVQLANIGKLQHYKPTQAHVDIVFAAVEEGVKAAKEMWQGKRKEKPGFTL